MSVETMDRDEDGAEPAERVLEMTRVFDAPRELVFKAWTEPEHLARWWGCAMTQVIDVDGFIRPGETFKVKMQLEDGSLHRVRGVCRDFERPERVSFTWAWEDEDGNLGHETLVTVTLVDLGGKTELNFRQALFETMEMRDLHHEGWSASFERLVGFLSAKQAA